jgi:hypothetical protein
MLMWVCLIVLLVLLISVLALNENIKATDQYFRARESSNINRFVKLERNQAELERYLGVHHYETQESGYKKSGK